MDRLPLLLLREQAESFGDDVRSELTEDEWSLCSSVLSGDYSGALSSQIILDLFKLSPNSTDPLEDLKANVSAVLERTEECKRVVLLVSGISILHAFIQCNWTGPPFSKQVSEILQLPADVASSVHSAALTQLGENGEECYSLCVAPELLWMARCILCDNSDKLENPVTQWWTLRCLMIWQQTLTDKLPYVWDRINVIRDRLCGSGCPIAPLLDSDVDLKCLLHLELTQSCLLYSQLTAAHDHLESAMKYAKLQSVGLTGALGKRTRFQDFTTAQLMLNVQTVTEGESTGGQSSTATPSEAEPAVVRDVKLGDDTVLDHIEFTEPVPNQSLNGLQLCTVLAMCLETQKVRPVDGLSREETMAFVERILCQPQSWSIQSRTLLLRCKAEAESTRRMERTMTQLQDIVDDFSKSAPSAGDRLRLFHCSNLPPRWMVERDLAKQLIRLGVVKSALDIFTHLEMWDDVIECLVILGRHGDAERLVRERLDVQETPALWCSLGDLTKDPEHYLKAWELSSHRSARAQRSLGLMYLRQGKFEECVEHLKLSLSVNCLQETLWFSLGCAAMSTDDLPLAASALHRSVTLEFDNYEAWTNLASVHIRMKQKPKAHKTLQEALRCNFEKWQIWHNFMLVCTDVGEFEDLVNAVHRLADLSPKQLDNEVLRILVDVITGDAPDAHGVPASRLLPKALKAFGHISSKVVTNDVVWQQYARLHFFSAEREKTNEQTAQVSREKGLQCLQKAQRLCCQNEELKHSVDVLKKASDLTLELANACECVSKGQANTTSAIQSLSSGKLALRSMIATAKKFTPADDQVEHVDGLIKALEARLEQVVEGLQIVKSAGQ
ncbi:tetratricopeptide repeat protein 27-like [Sycon ciliatum]|uniref:tetratricopeptide repeat protein 27-like n=1 Tax=Sycon ciliatum TaxID=27933 RepID=UPI0031F6A8CB|eukprot:scpid33731/ scgid34192/ Tetratricopeptide repeat protein 27